jgi:hypothetical protein
MRYRRTIASAALLAALLAASAGAQSQDAAKYPDWSGQWRWTASGGNRYDQTKPIGRGQQAPLTAEYDAIFEASMADQAAGGQGNNQTFACVPGGMPRIMGGNQGLEFIVTPKTTHVVFVDSMPRRIYTDGRKWPDHVERTFNGYSIGRWLDEDGDGRYDVLEVETRHLNGPRTIDNIGIPLHADNDTVIKERLYADKGNPDTLHNDITTIDHAFTQPWRVLKTYRRQKDPNWFDNVCTVGNQHVQIGKEGYYLSADGLLMPTKKGQPPPDLRYFEQVRR